MTKFCEGGTILKFEDNIIGESFQGIDMLLESLDEKKSELSQNIFLNATMCWTLDLWSTMITMRSPNLKMQLWRIFNIKTMTSIILKRLQCQNELKQNNKT